MSAADSSPQKKNPAAVRLGKLRAATITPEERAKWSAAGRKAAMAVLRKQTPEQRKERAQKAAAARWGKKDRK